MNNVQWCTGTVGAGAGKETVEGSLASATSGGQSRPVLSLSLSDCNVINNRGGGGPFPWWPLQATTPRSCPIAEIFSSSNGLELVAVHRPTCRSRIRVERLPPRSRVSWLLSIFLPQVLHDSCHCRGKFIDDGNAIAQLSNICRIIVDYIWKRRNILEDRS